MGGPTSVIKPDPRYPVTRLLNKALAGLRGKIPDGEATGNRHEVVSESLCDDVISYLAPTLDQHKGCTLIDVHPGSCLWSTKLHQYLQPKRHLLMEPDDRYYEPFIKPLLSQPDSAYRWTRLPGAHPLKYWANYDAVMKDRDLMPSIPAYPVGDPRRRLLNKDVLLVGNLAREYRATNSTSMDYSLLILLQMIRASSENTIIHQSGPVRMLWWLSEEKKSTVFPATDLSIHGVNASYGLGASISEVAGTVSTSTMYEMTGKQFHKKPLSVIDAICQKRIHESAKDLGMSKPDSRDWLNPQYAKRPKLDVNPLTPWEGGIEVLQQKIKEDKDRLSVVEALIATGRTNSGMWKVPKKLERTMEYPHCISICEHVKRNPAPSKGRDSIAGVVLDMHLRITKLEATLKELEETCSGSEKPKLPALEADIRSMDAELNNTLDTIVASRSLAEQIARALDFTTSFNLTPPLLANYSRTYPPIRIQPDEIYPPNPAKGFMLLDLDPKHFDLSVPDLATSFEGTKTAQTLIKLLYGSRNEILATQLDKIALNAAQDLIPEVPAITDARKGGRLEHRRYVRVRMLTPEMIVGLARAWVEWPFKPSVLAMELAAEGMEEVEDMETRGDEHGEDPTA